MIKKVKNLELVPDDIKNLLYKDEGELVPIGKNVYEIYQFPLNKYFKLLKFISNYYTIYNEVFNDNTNEQITLSIFLNNLTEKLIENNLINEFFEEMFPEIDEDKELITYEQLKYLLGVIYKLNFLSQKAPIKDPTKRAAIEKMMNVLGLQNIQLNL